MGRKLNLKYGTRRQGDPAILCASPDRLMRELGWQPRLSDLSTIIRSAWDWKQQHPNGYNGANAKLVPLATEVDIQQESVP